MQKKFYSLPLIVQRIFIASLFLLPPVPFLNAIQEPSLKVDTENVEWGLSTPARYVIKLGNIPLGLGAVEFKKSSEGLISKYSFQFLSRVGASPFLTSLQGEINRKASVYTLKQTLTSKTEAGPWHKFESQWDFDEKLGTVSANNNKASLTSLFPIRLEARKGNPAGGKALSLFYYAPSQAALNAGVLVPLTGQIVDSNSLPLEYASDGFLQRGNLPLTEGLVLTFERLPNKKDFLSYTNTLGNALIDVGWLTSQISLLEDTKSLFKVLADCSAILDDTAQTMLKQLPQAPYLSYRKVINMAHFCKRGKQILDPASTVSPVGKISQLGAQMKSLLKESPQELPSILSRSPDTTLFHNDTIFPLWTKVAEILVQKSISEIKTNFDLEKNRKSLVNIKLHIANLKPRSVVRADIEQVFSPIQFNVEAESHVNMKATSLTQIPTTEVKSVASPFLNGQTFANKTNLNLNLICRATGGHIGIDLGDAPQMVINEGMIRGLWDTVTRLEAARLFAIQATSARSCNKISFLAPIALKIPIEKELATFKNFVLGTQNELLLSNSIPKKLFLIPGKYHITISSLISGNVLATQEFSIENDTNATVVAKID